MPRALALTPTATWWPSTLWQTSTLELRRSGERLLVDPGIAPWEVEEVVAAAAEPVHHVLLTHGDWDHVLGAGRIAGARVVAGRATAARLRLPSALDEVRVEAAAFYLEAGALDDLRVQVEIDPPVELELGAFRALVIAAPGHTDDGIGALFRDEGVLAVGDYLSPLEIPAVSGSPEDYAATLRRLAGVLEHERPAHVVIGHGAPLRRDDARRVADEDLDYLERLLDFARAGASADRAPELAVPERAFVDAEVRVANLRRALASLAGG